MKEVLKKYFGYDNFRPLQEEIINSVIEKKDVFVLMPTGGGKSLCYQIPALKLQGVTLVISPLIALMKDQVDSMKAKGIPAEFMNSSLAVDELASIQFKILAGEVKLLYIAPERLNVPSFVEFLKSIKINLIAIDEAHCISEWGHDFRPSYRQLKNLKKTFPNIPLIALTATATHKIKKDICKQLSLTNPKIFISSFDRQNLNFIIKKKNKTFEKLLELLKKHKEGSSIIYCFSRKEVEKITAKLNDKGFKAIGYHAGFNNNIRKFNQELFIKNKVSIVVATIAFGMGIDKPNVRLVVHYNFPKTLEGYYQEIGRAGRDGLPSDCVLFYSRGDMFKHNYFIKKITDEKVKYNVENKLNSVMSFCESKTCRRKVLLNYFGEDFLEENCGGCDVCLNLNEEEKNTPKKVHNIFDECSKKNKEIKYDKDLFDKLKALRKRLANVKNVPSFVIFGDKSLKEMACDLPKDKYHFLQINGVGELKLREYGDLFLDLIKDYVLTVDKLSEN